MRRHVREKKTDRLKKRRERERGDKKMPGGGECDGEEEE